VIRVPSLYPVPGSVRELLGLTRHGGEPLAVLDIDVLAASVTVSGASREVVVVVSAGGELALGLAVDDAERVAEVRCSLPSPGSAGFVLGTAGYGEDTIQLLDPGWLLRGENQGGDTPS
jgi:chemotaxis signal transduction protein